MLGKNYNVHSLKFKPTSESLVKGFGGAGVFLQARSYHLNQGPHSALMHSVLGRHDA